MTEKFKPRMGNGDTGSTDLFGGKRVPKTDRRIKLNALIDDLSSLLGLLRAGIRDRKIKNGILSVQESLILAGGNVSGAKTDLRPRILAIEKLAAALAAGMKPPEKFVLPGSNETEALIHLARTRARLCEILAWEIRAKDSAVYLNRLSDYLFLLALRTVRP